MEYVKPATSVTIIVPVASAHVGAMIFTAGAAGVAGCAGTTADAAGEVHSSAFLAVTL